MYRPLSISELVNDEKKRRKGQEKKKKKKKTFTCEDEEEENKPDGVRKVACPIEGSLREFDCVDIEVSLF